MISMMTNDNDSGVCDDDYGNDVDDVRHRPPFPAISRPPALLDGGGWGARKAQRGTAAMVDNDDNHDDDNGIC